MTALQEAYLRKVSDTVNDLDNALYEVANEAADYSTEWQYHVIRYLKQYEAEKPKAHPVGMTFQYKGGSNRVLYESPADWISPNPGEGGENYRREPARESPGEGDYQRYGSPVGPYRRRRRVGVEELLPRAERGVHGGVAAVAHVAGFGARGHGADAAVRGAHQSGGDDAGREDFADALLPGRSRAVSTWYSRRATRASST